MGFLDKLKDVGASAKSMAEGAAQKAAEKADQIKADMAEKKAAQEAYNNEMMQKAEEIRVNIVSEIKRNGEGSAGFFEDVTEKMVFDFTKDFYDKILLPANSVQKSNIIMHPYIDNKKVTAISKSFPMFDSNEKPLIYLKAANKQEFVFTYNYLYFKIALPDDKKFFAIDRVACNDISNFIFEDTADGGFVFKCDSVELVSFMAENAYKEDFITLNNFFKCIKEKDFEITDEEIDSIIHEKIGDKIYEQVSRYFTYDDELAIYFAWGLDSLTAKDYVVCTTKQIIIMDRELLGATANVRQFYYEDITSMQTIQNSNSNDLTVMLIDAALTAAFKQCDLEINVSGAKNKINTLFKVEAERVIAIYHEYRKALKTASSQPQVVIQQSNEPDVLEQLEKLSKLKDMGIISEDEFNTKKVDLLAKL